MSIKNAGSITTIRVEIKVEVPALDVYVAFLREQQKTDEAAEQIQQITAELHQETTALKSALTKSKKEKDK
jgi:hypothetical protein